MNPDSDQDSNVPPGIVGTDGEESEGKRDRMVDEERWYHGEVMGLHLGPHEVANKLRVDTQYVPFGKHAVPCKRKSRKRTTT